MVLTVISFRDVVKLRNAVQKIDPDALVMVSTISEVRGRGFSSDRVALPKTEDGDAVENLKEVQVSEVQATDTAQEVAQNVAQEQVTSVAQETKQEQVAAQETKQEETKE